MVIRPAAPADAPLVRELFTEYQRGLGLDLGFQGFADEIEEPFEKYRLILFAGKEEVAACAALKNLGDGIAEIKRLYVRPAFRRMGLARALSVRLIEEAVALGYRAVRLDTLRRLPGALDLYLSLGFQEIPPYNENSEPDIVYLERRL